MPGQITDPAHAENRQAHYRGFVAGRDRLQPAIARQALPHQHQK